MHCERPILLVLESASRGLPIGSSFRRLPARSESHRIRPFRSQQRLTGWLADGFIAMGLARPDRPERSLAPVAPHFERGRDEE